MSIQIDNYAVLDVFVFLCLLLIIILCQTQAFAVYSTPKPDIVFRFDETRDYMNKPDIIIMSAVPLKIYFDMELVDFSCNGLMLENLLYSCWGINCQGTFETTEKMFQVKSYLPRCKIQGVLRFSQAGPRLQLNTI